LSNVRFEFAEPKIDDLYTKSISRSAFSLITSDLVLRFEPRGVESLLVNYYQGLNYLRMWEPEEAWVEWRRLAAKLQYSRDKGDALYLDPPFFNHVVGLGLEWDDPSNAYVSLRLAEAGYRDRGLDPPPDLIDDLVRLATALGFADHLDLYRNRYGDAAVGATERGRGRSADGPSESGPWGEIILLVEEGLVAPIEELQVYLPITERRAESLVEGGRNVQLNIAESLAREYADGRYDGARKSDANRREIAYVLPMSFPVYGMGEPAFSRLVAFAETDTLAARVALRVTDLQQMAFTDRLLGIYAKTIARALIKYLAASKLEEKAEEEGGETAGDVVGILANIVNVATERADTRAWLGLPHRIWMTRLRVPPGDHDVQLLIDGHGVITLGPIDVRPGERRLVNYRIF